MADAKIVNIKGVQWDLKDEAARNRITTLETEVNTNIPERFTTDETKINDIYKIASGNSIQQCCTKLNFPYSTIDISYAIDYVFKNPELYPTGIHNVSVGGPAFLLIVQNLNSNYMSIIATGYTTSDIFKATKTYSEFSLGIIKKTSSIN